jgi:hypothetical protein
MSTVILTRSVNAGRTIHVNDEESLRIVREFDCDSSTLVGQPVILSSTEINKVIVPNNNFDVMPIFGIVESKITATTCKVITHGYSDVTFTGLVKNKNIFLSSDGALTTDVPLSGYMQILGIAYEDNKMYVNIGLQITLMG